MGENPHIQAQDLLDAAQAAGEAVARIERLQRLTAALASASTAVECAAALSTAGRVALQAQAAFVWLVEAGGQTLELAASDGYAGPDLERFRTIPLDGPLPVCDALRSGQPIFLESPGDRRQRYPVVGDGAGAGFQSWAAIPFLHQGRPIGALSVSFDRQRAFHIEERALIVTMAAQSSQAIERTRLYDAEVRARKEVEQANRSKDEFLAMLGHELRNPLSPIVTALQLMRVRGGDVMLKERTIIERQVKHMARLVDDLLDVSRVARGKVVLSRAPVELAEVLAKAVETVSPALEERSHQLSVSVPARGLVVDGDEERLAQVFDNLLNNAGKFTEPGGHIQIVAEARDGRARVSIRDNGAGMDATQLPHIFDLFMQARDGARGGLGIGLTIVRNLVALHGGTVAAHSEGPGRGSEFVVELPLAAAGAADRPAPSPPRPIQRSDARRVLIVDDNRDAADSLCDGLTACGHATAVAYDGATALEAAATFQPHIALLDIGLPVMDGYELARRLRAHSPALALVALTGFGLESDRDQARAAGFQEHLVKPIDLEALEALVGRLCPR
jgi:signal transduction histidine kinase/CheY-like chemotaxis protein